LEWWPVNLSLDRSLFCINEGIDGGFMQNLKSISFINMMVGEAEWFDGLTSAEQKRQLNHTWSQSLDKLHFEGLFGESADHIDKSDQLIEIKLNQ